MSTTGESRSAFVVRAPVMRRDFAPPRLATSFVFPAITFSPSTNSLFSNGSIETCDCDTAKLFAVVFAVQSTSVSTYLAKDNFGTRTSYLNSLTPNTCADALLT